MSRGLRRTVAVSQIAGGILMLGGVATGTIGGMRLQLWYGLLLVSLGTVSVAAGLGLRRGDPRAIRWSRPLLALQVLQVKTATWGGGLFLGLHVSLTAGDTGWGASLGVAGRLDLYGGAGMPSQMSVNLFALAALMALSEDRHPLPIAGPDLPPDSAPVAHPEPAA